MLIAQLSDPHVCAENTLYQGLVDSNAMLVAAVRHVNELLPVPDVVILSGDVTENGADEEYAHCRKILSAIEQPLIVIPGNHDKREAFRSCFSDMDYLPQTGPLHFVISELGPVRIVGIDVIVSGAHHGEINDQVIDWLDDCLAAEPDRPTMIILHQPPFKSGIPFIDEYRCFGGERLEKLLANYTMVERVVCGHVHRFIQRRFAGTLICTAPSTTTSIALRLSAGADPASYLEPPALLLHSWHPTDGMVTHLVPVGSFPGPYEFF
ncbi:MAG: phosphodiesterase [Hyphomicrobiaceae bacterium]